MVFTICTPALVETYPPGVAPENSLRQLAAETMKTKGVKNSGTAL